MTGDIGGTPPLAISLLGGFALRAGDAVVLDRAWNRQKALALLKLLALAPGRTMRRDDITAALWPGMAQRPAANSLYKTLYYIRSACTARGIEAEIAGLRGATVTLAPDVSVDVDDFRATASLATAAPTPDTFTRAIALYRGDLLPDDALEPWTAAPREQLQRLWHMLLFDAACLYAHQDAPLAIERLETLTTAVPTHESGQMELMRLYASAGQRERALRQYAICRDALMRELDAQPSAGIEQLHRVIRDGRAEIAARPRDVATPAFVGRGDVLQKLDEALSDAIAGRGRLRLLAGDAGIGKTWTGEALGMHATSRGALVLWGRCYEGEGAPAYWPWLQIIAGYIDRRGAPAALQAMGDGAAVIAQVSPETRAICPAAEDVPMLEPEQARFRLFDALARFLRQAGPLVLIIDDLHGADRASLLFLAFLARELRTAPVMVLGTYRDLDVAPDHPLTDVLAALAREDVCERIELRGLAEPDVREFIREAAGVEPADRAVDALFKKSEGNPFFLREMLRLVVAGEGAARLQDDAAPDLPVPPSVRDAVGRRLRQLSPATLEGLSVASVVGRHFTVELLRGAGVADPLSALEEAEAARLIVPMRSRPGRFRFSHALIRESLYEDLGSARRVALHGRVGEAVEAQQHGDMSLHLAELAYHFFEAAPGGDAMRAVEYARRSAERSAELLAYEEAVESYRRALAALDLLPAPDLHLRTMLLLALGDALKSTGNIQGAFDTFRQAAVIARNAGDAETLARAALKYEGSGVATGAVDDSLVAILREALGALPEQDSALRARLLGRLAIALYWLESLDERETLSRASMQMARRLGDPGALAYALKARHVSLSSARIEERLGVSTELIRMAKQAGDRDLQFSGHTTRVVDFMEIGDIESADAEMAAFGTLTLELQHPSYAWAYGVRQAMRALVAGEFGEGERLAREAYATGTRVRHPNVRSHFGMQLFTAYAETGRFAELEVITRSFTAEFPALIAWRVAHAYLLTEAGRLDEARAVYDVIAAQDFALFEPERMRMGATICGLVAARLGDAQGAATLYALLAPFAGRGLVFGPGIGCWGAVSRYLGVLAAALDRGDDAARHFEAALEFNERMGAWPYLAHTQAEFAAFLLARGESGRALRLAHTALATARRLGMPPLVKQAAALLTALGEPEEGSPV